LALIKKEDFSIFWILNFIVFFIIISLGLFSPPKNLDLINFPDKLMHFLSFFFLSIFLFKSNKFFTESFFFIIFYAVVSEFIQMHLIYRSADLIDLIFNFLGYSSLFFKSFYFKALEKL